jgi:hypothetical protein
MKLRKVLFVLIVAILVFDIALIARHKRLPLRPPLASGAAQDSKPAESPKPVLPPTGIIRCYQDAATSHFICMNAHGKTLDVTAALTETDESNPKAKAPPVEIEPPMEWEPPAPKPAGERKL